MVCKVNRTYRKTYCFLDRETQHDKDVSFKLFHKCNAILVIKKITSGFFSGARQINPKLDLKRMSNCWGWDRDKEERLVSICYLNM